MKEREIYADIKAPTPLIIRIDGRNFHNLSEVLEFDKPYDLGFAESMANATEIFFEKSGFNPEIAYIFSDEVNIFLREVPFNGRIEKLVSVVSSFFSSVLTILLLREKGKKVETVPISFDGRVIPICEHHLIKYLEWRQREAWRNHVNSYGYYALKEEGLKGEEIQNMLRGMKSPEIHDFLLLKKGINLNETPAWQRRGILVGREVVEKGKTTRKRIVQIWTLPIFKSEEGRELIERISGSGL